MHGPFERYGRWWDPRHPDNYWHGTLTFTPSEGGRLSVLFDQRRQSFERREEYPVIHGVCGDGEHVSLLNCFDLRFGSFGNGPRGEDVHHGDVFVNGVIFGLWTSESDPALASAEVLFDCARAWVGQSGIELARPSMQTFGLEYTRPSGEALYWDEHIAIYVYSTLAATPTAADRDGNVNLREETRFRLLPVAPMPLSGVLEYVYAIENLLSVACLHLCRLERLLIRPAARDPTSMGYGTYHRRAQFPDHEAPAPDATEIAFPLSSVARPPMLFERWVTKRAELRTVLELYLSALYADAFLYRKLVDIVQACEVFHRRFREKRAYYIDRKTYKTDIMPKLLAALPEGIDPATRKMFNSRFSSANEISLRSRLEELADEHKAILERFVPEAAAIIVAAGKYRIDFTHYPKVAPADSRADMHAMDECLALLTFVLELSLLREMGFDAQQVATIVENGNTYRQRLVRWRSQR